MSKHTPGPWTVKAIDGEYCVVGPGGTKHVQSDMREAAECVAKYLNTAWRETGGPDHAMVLRMIARGVLRWEPFRAGGDAGELVFAGLRHSTQLDEFGCPILTDALRAAIAKAEGGGK